MKLKYLEWKTDMRIAVQYTQLTEELVPRWSLVKSEGNHHVQFGDRRIWNFCRRTTHILRRRVLGSVPWNAAYASANYGHSFTALLGVFPFAFFTFCKSLHENIKFCNLNPGVCYCTAHLILSPKGYTSLTAIFVLKSSSYFKTVSVFTQHTTLFGNGCASQFCLSFTFSMPQTKGTTTAVFMYFIMVLYQHHVRVVHLTVFWTALSLCFK